jgi:ATP-dependent RNA helicase RhlB
VNALESIEFIKTEDTQGKEHRPQPAPSDPTRPDQPAGSGRRRRSRRWRKSTPQREGITTPETVADKEWRVSDWNVPVVEGKTRFHDFVLPDPLMHAICDLGYEYCTPIQSEILPSTLAGKDANGRAQTGTGKTAAFLITVITRILTNPIRELRPPGTPRVLVLAPTRELVLQISQEVLELAKYTGIKTLSVFGGMDYKKQLNQLSSGPVDIMVATPGRLMDFMWHGYIDLKKIEVLIIDEADRMLDMGFIPDVRDIVYRTPPKHQRQTLLFSATLTSDITRLASQWTVNPVTVEIDPEQVAVDTIDQIVYIVTVRDKFALLYNVIMRQNLSRVLVFCNRRDEVLRLSKLLDRFGINTEILSGVVPQKTRIRRLDDFKAGKIRVMVATDVASRGIHIEGMNHVVNYTLPHEPENYVHRIGRTGRAGAIGTSISFADETDAFYLPAIEQYLQHKLKCIVPDDDWLILPEARGKPKWPNPDRFRR